MGTTINWTQAVSRADQIERENIQHEAEFKQTLSDAKKEVMERIYDTTEPFSYGDIEDIMMGHGLEMDYIEDFLL